MGSKSIISLNERKSKEDEEEKNTNKDWAGNEQGLSEVVTIFFSLFSVEGVGEMLVAVHEVGEEEPQGENGWGAEDKGEDE